MSCLRGRVPFPWALMDFLWGPVEFSDWQRRVVCFLLGSPGFLLGTLGFLLGALGFCWGALGFLLGALGFVAEGCK